jgi:lipopolysaccharide assembly protein A
LSDLRALETLLCLLEWRLSQGDRLKYLLWLLKAAIFFTLFAFALNNQQDATVHFFFGTQWRAPLVLVVLVAFALGLSVGALGMVPRWWKQRRVAVRSQRTTHPAAEPLTSQPPPPVPLPITQPPHGI